MIKSITTIRTLYADVDKMGFVYYGNYATYYEVGRANAMRELKTSYREMEEKGILMPVQFMVCHYYKPAHYDELLTITTVVNEMPKARMVFDYEVHNEQGELLNNGQTSLAFLNKDHNRPQRIPDWFAEILKPYFKQ
ncbi:MAG: acyl-CoA thioesterase [Bacteroidales bacterium]|nr:acyl-CoA thioesterase [Bacteroidales bacterium]